MFKKRRREKSYRECSQPAVDRYSGKKLPYCNGGRGCRACWAKHLRVNNKTAVSRTMLCFPGDPDLELQYP